MKYDQHIININSLLTDLKGGEVTASKTAAIHRCNGILDSLKVLATEDAQAAVDEVFKKNSPPAAPSAS